MYTSSPFAQPEIQAELIAEALRSASVGFLVWDESRRYIAARRHAVHGDGNRPGLDLVS